MFLGFRLAKSQQTSDWGQWPLRPAQLQYAALDAWVSREVFFHLRKQSTADGQVVEIRPETCAVGD